MSGANLSTVNVMSNEDPITNDDIQLVAFMLPNETVAKLRSYAMATGETQHRVVAAALEQYIAARKKQ